jgi:hypothetical protein
VAEKIKNQSQYTRLLLGGACALFDAEQPRENVIFVTFQTVVLIFRKSF